MVERRREVRLPHQVLPQDISYRGNLDFEASQRRLVAAETVFRMVAPPGISGPAEERLRLGIKTLGAESATPDQLGKIFSEKDAEAVIAEGFPRDMDGDPIVADLLFAITSNEAWATALHFGLQDGQSRTIPEVAFLLGNAPITVEAQIKSVLAKLRRGEIVTIIEDAPVEPQQQTSSEETSQSFIDIDAAKARVQEELVKIAEVDQVTRENAIALGQELLECELFRDGAKLQAAKSELGHSTQNAGKIQRKIGSLLNGIEGRTFALSQLNRGNAIPLGERLGRLGKAKLQEAKNGQEVGMEQKKVEFLIRLGTNLTHMSEMLLPKRPQ